MMILNSIAKITTCSIATLLITGGLSLPTQANSRARFALTCVGTETGDTINFQARWGSNDTWESYSVRPGRWAMFTHDYDYPGENRSPQFQIRYDDDLSSDVHIVITDLDSYAAENRYCEGEGATYTFHSRGLELYVVEE
ncbi:hypothetical protein [Baaleninema sp.]|uniref:hypothetical protein n=1 Tax=Baaleninema sp. TaxID=3101197 RepID=UPI003D0537CF